MGDRLVEPATDPHPGSLALAAWAATECPTGRTAELPFPVALVARGERPTRRTPLLLAWLLPRSPLASGTLALVALIGPRDHRRAPHMIRTRTGGNTASPTVRDSHRPVARPVEPDAARLPGVATHVAGDRSSQDVSVLVNVLRAVDGHAVSLLFSSKIPRYFLLRLNHKRAIGLRLLSSSSMPK